MNGGAAHAPATVPTRLRLAFGVGAVAEGTKTIAFNVFLLFYYNQVLGVSGTASGLAILLALCVDAVMDPLVGSLSDALRSRWGRRHPFMYAAAVPLGVSLALVFRPPAAATEAVLCAWLFVFSVLVRVSLTLFMLPSNALVPELTSNYDERTSLVSYRFLFGWLAALGVAQIGYLHFFASPDGGVTDGRLAASGYAGFGAACGLLAALAVLLSSAGTHSLIPRLARASGTERFTPRRFLGELRDVLAHRSFRVLAGAALFSSVAGGFSDVVGLYMNTYFWGLSSDQIAILIVGLAGSVAIGLLVARPLNLHFDKRNAALGLAGFAILVGPLPIFLRLANLFPANGHPALLPLLLGHAVLVTSAVVAIGITVASMLADVADEGELRTGRRQEGMFMAAITFTAKATSGIGSFLAGVALDVIAFPRGVAPGAVAPGKVFMLGLAVGPGLLLLYLTTLALLSRYGITRERHREVLRELERRRAAAPERDPLRA